MTMPDVAISATLACTGTTGHVIDPEGINHPKHYNSHPCGIEVIEVTDLLLSFNNGNVFKYSIRANDKDGLKDLGKSVWYAKRAVINYDYSAFSGYQSIPKQTELKKLLTAFLIAEPDPLIKNVLFCMREALFYNGNSNAVVKACEVLLTEKQK